MEVSAGADWLGENNTSSVDRLPSLEKVTAASNFLDEDWSHSLRSQLLVDDHEVDFGSTENLLPDTQGHGNS